MFKKNSNKKGFTIVELVIVIAVIAILASVLIPTFSSVIAKANKSAAMQAARNEYELYLAENAEKLTGEEDFVIKSGKYFFKVTDGQFNSEAIEDIPAYYKLDLTTNEVKSFNAGETTLPTNVTNAYTREEDALDETNGKTSGLTVGSTYYYVVAIDEIGNKDVAIYVAKN